MAASLGTLVVDIKTDTAKFTQGLETSNRKLESFGKTIKRVTVSLGGLFAVKEFAQFIGRTVDAGDEIQKLSQRLGASTEALSQYRHVAALTGVEFNTMTQALQRMTRRVSEAANGTGEAINALNELGLSASKLEELRPDEQFEVLADAMAGVEQQSDKVRLAMKLFDSEGVALLQTMEGGSAAIKAMREEADRLGVTLDQAAVDKMAAVNDSMARMKAGTVALANSLTLALGPTIAEVSNWLAVHVPKGVEIAIKAFQAFRHYVVEIGERITRFVEGTVGTLSVLADWVGADELSERLYNSAQGMKYAADAMDQMQVQWALGSETAKTFSVNVTGAGYSLEQFAGSNEKASSATGKTTAAIQQMSAEAERLKELMSEGQSLWESTRTPAERLNLEYTRLNELLEAGAVDWDTYARATLKAQEQFDGFAPKLDETTSRIDEFARSAAENMESQLAGFFRNFDKGLDGMLSSFVDTLRNMAAELAASEVMNFLLGDFGKSGKISGFIGDLLGNFKFPGFATGGNFVVGGTGGTDSQLVAFRATPGERVSVQTPGGQQQGQTVNLTVNMAPQVIDGRDFVGRVDQYGQEIARVVMSKMQRYNLR